MLLAQAVSSHSPPYAWCRTTSFQQSDITTNGGRSAFTVKRLTRSTDTPPFEGVRPARFATLFPFRCNKHGDHNSETYLSGTAKMANLNARSDDQACSSEDREPDACISDLMLIEDLERSTELVELVYLLKLGVKTNLRWLAREEPDIDAARKTSARLCKYVDRLQSLIATGSPDRLERL